MEEKRLTREEEKALLDKIYEGSPVEANEAWQEIFETYQGYIRSLAYERIGSIELPKVISKADLMDDLEQAGWTGFFDSFLSYSPGGDAKLLTYAKKAINREINKEFFGRYLVVLICLAVKDLDELKSQSLLAELSKLRPFRNFHRFCYFFDL